jgi:hypothetical protein
MVKMNVLLTSCITKLNLTVTADESLGTIKLTFQDSIH